MNGTYRLDLWHVRNTSRRTLWVSCSDQCLLVKKEIAANLHPCHVVGGREAGDIGQAAAGGLYLVCETSLLDLSYEAMI